MFNNISGKLKGWAIATAIIGNISAIFSGVSLITQAEDLVVLGIVIMVVGIITAWLSAWILFGVGDLLDTTNSVYNKTNKIISQLDDISRRVDKLTEGGEVATPQAEENGVITVAVENGKIVCPQCGYEQDGGRKRCWKCGTNFYE